MSVCIKIFSHCCIQGHSKPVIKIFLINSSPIENLTFTLGAVIKNMQMGGGVFEKIPPKMVPSAPKWFPKYFVPPTKVRKCFSECFYVNLGTKLAHPEYDYSKRCHLSSSRDGKYC